MEDVDEEPSWLDWSLIDRGAKVFRSFGPAAAASAGSGTLLAYTESSIAKPLSLTGTYTGGSALRRFMETQRPTFDVSEQDGLRRGGAGRATSVRVRIMHVYLRRKIGGHEEWDEAAWVVPINQSDALITLMSGSVINALGMRLIGHPVSNSDIAALMHLWRYVGHIMGVHPRWYPATPREGIQLGAVYFLKRAYSAGSDGTELINSYLPAFRPKAGEAGRGESVTSSTTASRSGIPDSGSQGRSTGSTTCHFPGRGRCIPSFRYRSTSQSASDARSALASTRRWTGTAAGAGKPGGPTRWACRRADSPRARNFDGS
jgi:hypothetical protein